MEQMDREYKPIACGLYDELELRALRKNKINLVFRNSFNEVEIIDCVIADLFSKNKVEYLKTEDGTIIRLDEVIELDNILFNKNC